MIDEKAKNTGNILILDDSEIVHHGIKRLLQENGYTIDSIYSASSVPDDIDKDYNLLILDVNLGKANGIDVLRKIREAGQSINVIVITGREDPEVRKQAFGLGAKEFLLKPIENVEELVKKIDSLIQ